MKQPTLKEEKMALDVRQLDPKLRVLSQPKDVLSDVLSQIFIDHARVTICSLLVNGRMYFNKVKYSQSK